MSASSGSCRLTCSNKLTELARLNADVQQFVGKHAVPPQAAYVLDLAIEELITNIIKYGYDETADHTIRIDIDRQPDHLLLTIEDDGHPFNPLGRESPDTTKPPEEREIGGLGLHMVREMSEKMEYRREGDRNITVVRIRV